MPLAELALPHCSHPSGRYRSQPLLERPRHAPRGLHTRPLDLHLGSADRQSLRHQLQKNIVALSPSTNHQVFPCRLTIGLSGASLRAYRDGIFFCFALGPPLKPDKKPPETEMFDRRRPFGLCRLRPGSPDLIRLPRCESIHPFWEIARRKIKPGRFPMTPGPRTRMLWRPSSAAAVLDLPMIQSSLPTNKPRRSNG